MCIPNNFLVKAISNIYSSGNFHKAQPCTFIHTNGYGGRGVTLLISLSQEVCVSEQKCLSKTVKINFWKGLISPSNP